MWQQFDCSAKLANEADRDFGCQHDLFPWVEVTVGAGSNGAAQTAGFTNATTGEGSTSMGFFNVQQGDAPYLKLLADTYSMSDNYHQAVNGGTGANHIMIGYGDAMYFERQQGQRRPPRRTPWSIRSKPGAPVKGAIRALGDRKPQPAAGHQQLLHAGRLRRRPVSRTATPVRPRTFRRTPVTAAVPMSNCADNTQPGIAPILDYLHALPGSVPSRCEQGHYYLVNNYNPGYFGDGSNAYTDTNPSNYVFTIPPCR